MYEESPDMAQFIGEHLMQLLQLSSWQSLPQLPCQLPYDGAIEAPVAMLAAAEASAALAAASAALAPPQEEVAWPAEHIVAILHGGLWPDAQSFLQDLCASAGFVWGRDVMFVTMNADRRNQAVFFVGLTSTELYSKLEEDMTVLNRVARVGHAKNQSINSYRRRPGVIFFDSSPGALAGPGAVKIDVSAALAGSSAPSEASALSPLAPEFHMGDNAFGLDDHSCSVAKGMFAAPPGAWSKARTAAESETRGGRLGLPEQQQQQQQQQFQFERGGSPERDSLHQHVPDQVDLLRALLRQDAAGEQDSSPQEAADGPEGIGYATIEVRDNDADVLDEKPLSDFEYEAAYTAAVRAEVAVPEEPSAPSAPVPAVQQVGPKRRPKAKSQSPPSSPQPLPPGRVERTSG
jgi:hypothetical protein